MSRHMSRVPEHVRRMPEHIRSEPVKKAARAGGSVALWLSFFALFLICVAVSMGRWWAPVYVETHRTELLAMISEASGTEILSDDMTLVWSRWGPRLQLTGLSVRAEDGEIPASLEKAQFSANVFKMLVLGKLIIDDVEVEGLHLDVLRGREGDWRLALSSKERPQQGTDWFEVLSRFRWLNLKDSVITFRDEKRQRHYVVEGVTVVANHYDNQYRINVDGDLPPHLGKKLRLIADLSGDAGNKLSGQMYLGMEQVNLTEFSSAVGSDKAQVSGRLEELEYWQQMTVGKSTNGQLRFRGENLRVNQPGDDTPWAVDLADLELGWERQDNDWDVWLDNLTVAANGEAWRSGYTRIKRSEDGKVQAQGEQLRLGSIALLLAQLTNIESVEALAQAAQQYDPRGDLVSWRLMLEPDAEGRINSAFEGLVSGLSVSSVDGKPGIHGLDALVRIKDNQLTTRVNSADLRFEAPKVFAKPLHFDRINGVIAAKLDPVDWWVRSDAVELVSGESEAVAVFDIAKPADYPGLAINLKSNFKNVDAESLPGFYPVGIMPANLSKWLKDGVHKGHVDAGEFIFRGHSLEFPFREGDGVMQANFNVKDLELDFSPGWPLVTEGDVDLEITGKGLTVAGTGRFDGAALENFKLDIPDYRDGRLLINGELETTGEAVREFARTGPLSDTLATYFEDLIIQGPVRLKLAPVVALNKGDQSTIDGVATLKGARVDLQVADVDLRRVHGDLPFDQNGLKTSSLQAEVYGKPMTARLKRLSNNKGLQIDARVEAPPASWLKKRQSPLADYLSGSGQMRVLVRLLNNAKGGKGNVTVSVTSDMKGIEVLAPAPVAKAAAEQRPFHIEGLIDARDRSSWNFSFGPDLGGRFNLDANGDLRSMALGAGETVPTMPHDGVRIRVNWARADVASWYDFVDNCCLQDESDSEGSYLDVYASIGEARWYNTPIGSGSLTMIDDESGLSGRINSGVAVGNFHYNYRVGEPAWDINFQRVNLTPFVEAETDDQSASDDLLDPSTVPVTRWKIDNLLVSDVKIKNISIETSPVSNGLRVDRMIISTNEYTGNGKGLWQLLKNGKHSSEIEMFLHANDLGQAVDSIGRADAITGGRGQVTLNLLWQDALYQPDIATMSGDVKLEMAEGRINKLDPGAGRLFGLLALQTLPQRLALDFSDLGEGLSYTQVKGEFDLADGIAKTRYLVLEGPIGAVSVVGDIDYVNQRFDERIVVLPNVGGSLPLIGAAIGGPVTAAGVFLADKIFRSVGLDVNRFGRRDYTLTGTFEAPELTQVVQPHEANSINRSDK